MYCTSPRAISLNFRNSAFLLLSLDQGHGLRLSVKSILPLKGGMGRITSGSMRTRIQDYMKILRDTFRAALKEDELQEAFDQLWPTWSAEMAAMIYAEVLSALDLLILTATVDNRREIMKIQQRLHEEKAR